MIDLKFIRENPEVIKDAVLKKRVSLDVDALLAVDQTVLELKRKIQSLQEEKNSNAKRVPQAKPEERGELIELGKKIGKELDSLQPKMVEAETQLQQFLWMVPNPPSSDTPVGKSEEDNVEIRRSGEIRSFEFNALDHVALIEKNDWAELERIAKVSGSRMYALKNDLVLLEFAVIQFALDLLRKKGFQLLTVPSMVREFALFGTGHFPTGRDQVYRLADDELFLSGTAEVPVNSLFSGEILSDAKLPLLFAAYSPCFRREAGSAGRDVRGLTRVHQFNKVEQFVICRNDPEESAHWHQTLLKTSEEIVQALELPWRVIECCTGDMGAGKFKMHDIEVWVPSEKKYRETHSCSSLHEWQARRANLRYRDAADKVKYCHTLNNTAVATPRILVPLIENHQLANGAVRIPQALRAWMGGRSEIGGM